MECDILAQEAAQVDAAEHNHGAAHTDLMVEACIAAGAEIENNHHWEVHTVATAQVVHSHVVLVYIMAQTALEEFHGRTSVGKGCAGNC